MQELFKNYKVKGN